MSTRAPPHHDRIARGVVIAWRRRMARLGARVATRGARLAARLAARRTLAWPVAGTRAAVQLARQQRAARQSAAHGRATAGYSWQCRAPAHACFVREVHARWAGNGRRVARVRHLGVAACRVRQRARVRALHLCAARHWRLEHGTSTRASDLGERRAETRWTRTAVT